MANIKQQQKRDITNKKKNLLNASFKSSLKTAVKAFEAAVAADNKEQAQETFKFACKKVDKAVSKGILHKNNAANQKSRLSKLLNTLA